MIKIKLTDIERNAILRWYKNISEDNMHYGKSGYTFPFEASLLNKLKLSEKIYYDLTDNEIITIFDWMEKSLFPKLGSSTLFLPGEESVYQKIKTAIESIEKKAQVDELIHAKIDKLNDKLRIVSKKIAEINAEKEKKKNRSIDEKIASTKKLKSDLNEIRKSLKFK